MIFRIYVLGPGAHSWGIGQCEGTAVVFEQGASDLRYGSSHIVAVALHLFDDFDQRDCLSQSLTERNVFALARAQCDLGLKRTLPADWATKVGDEVASSASISVGVAHCLFLHPVAAEIRICPHLE